jgi:hypothetical protein
MAVHSYNFHSSANSIPATLVVGLRSPLESIFRRDRNDLRPAVQLT